jgi:hypothetical protein
MGIIGAECEPARANSDKELHTLNLDNQARIAHPAVRASGSALHVVQGTRASLLSCTLRHNAAGGPGYTQWKRDYANFAS